MIGRAKEWERALRLTARVDGGPCVLLIDGPAGIGKTTLHESVATHAATSGFTVMRCRPSQLEVGLARSGLLQLMDGVDESVVDTLPAPQRKAMRVALRWDEPSGPPIEGQTIASAFTSVLRTVAGAGRVLIALDDTHWLDDDTAHAVVHAVSRVDGLPVAVVATWRTPLDREEVPIGRAVDPARVDRIRVGPLSAASVRLLLQERLDLRISEGNAARITKAADGNPFVALELGRLVALNGMPPTGVPFPVPENVRELVVRRLRALPASTRAALVDASAMAAPAAPPLDAVALADAETAGLVTIRPDRSVVFVHPLYESAIYTSISDGERREIHARLAASTADPEERAHHLGLASDEPDAAAAAAIGAAADLARRRGAFDQAILLAERAWQRTPVDDRDARSSRAVQLAETVLRSGRAADAVEVVARVVPDLAGMARGQALMIAGEAQMWADAPADAIATFHRAIEDLAPDPARVALAHLNLAFLYSQVLGDFPGGVEHAAVAVALAEAAGPGAPLAEARAVLTMASIYVGGGFVREELDRDVAEANPDLPVAAYLRPDALRAICIGYADDVDEAVEWFDAEVSRARMLGRASDMTLLSLVGIPLAAYSGDVAMIERCVAAAREADSVIGSPLTVTLGRQLIELALDVHTCDRSQDRVAGIRQRAARLGQQCADSGINYLAMWLPSTMAAFELALANGEGALAWIEPMIAPLEVPDFPIDPAIFSYVPNGCEALVLAGQHDRARAMIDRVEGECEHFGRMWATGAIRRARATLLMAEGRLDEAADEARAAAEILAQSGFRVERGRAQLVQGLIARRLRRRAEAREQLDRADATLDAAGCTLWATLAATERDRTWAAGGDGVLTPSEARMAELAARGMANPQIASTLYVSRRTVEATLSRVYRKLGVAGRAELAGALGGDAVADT